MGDDDPGGCATGPHRWLWLVGYAVSVATVVGFIGLAGTTCEFEGGVLSTACVTRAMEAVKLAFAALNAAVPGGALLRVRSFAMIVVVTLAGPLPILPIVAVHVSGPCVQPF